MIVRRCTFDGTDTGVRFNTSGTVRRAAGGPENVTYEDLVMKSVGVAISVSSYYEDSTLDSTLAGDKPQTVTPTTPQWRNITVRNVTSTAGTKRAGLIAGLPEMLAENITLDHVTIEAPTGLRIANAKGIVLHDVHITAATGPDVISDGSVQPTREPRNTAAASSWEASRLATDGPIAGLRSEVQRTEVTRPGLAANLKPSSPHVVSSRRR